MANLIGQSIGRYHILEQLGEGGMATVYKAFDTRLERDVAVKVIRRAAFPPEQLDHILKRFEREAKALAKLSHPNIVGIIDYGEYEGSPYLVMEFLPSGTLTQYLGKPVPWPEAARLLLPVARALQFAHGKGIVHRDIKPANILITDSGEPMLSDFGIAKILESEETTNLTGTGFGVGTPAYMAPEQWTGKVVPQSDIYSLGVVLYEMVTGRKPYVADTPSAIMLKQATEPLPRPKTFAPDLPESVEKVLLKALARKTEDRYRDMADFVDGLENVLIGQPKGKKQIGVKPVVETQATFLQEDLPADRVRGAVRRSEEKPGPSAKKKTGGWRWAAIGAGLICVIALGAIGLSGFKKAAPSPTATLTPTLSPTKAFTQTNTPLRHIPAYPDIPFHQSLLPITAGNVTDIALLARLGEGVLVQAVWSPDGSILAMASSTGVYLYDASSKKEIRFIQAPDYVTFVAFSPDGTLLAGALGDSSVQLWKVSDGSLLRGMEGHSAVVTSVAFSPDGTMLASAAWDATIRLWRVSDGVLSNTLKGHSSGVLSVVFSPDGKLLASGGYDKTVRLWQVADGTLQRILAGHSDAVMDIAFSPDGSFLASGSFDKTIRLWRVSDGTVSLTLKGHTDKVVSVAFSKDGSALASGSYDLTIRVWRTSDGGLEKILEGQTGAPVSLDFSPDGTSLASLTGRMVFLWQTSDWTQTYIFNNHADAFLTIAFSPDASLLAIGATPGTSVTVIRVSDGTILQTLEGHTSSIYSVAFSPDGTLLASASPDGTARLWRVSDGSPLLVLKGHTCGVLSAAFSPDGTMLATGSCDNTVRLWRVSDGSLLRTLEGHSDRILTVAFSPDGTMLASGSRDSTIRLWRIPDGSLIHSLKRHSDWVDTVAFSPDGTLLASGSRDKTMRFWRVSDGSLVRTLEHTYEVSSVAFSPDGSLIAGGAYDATVRLSRVADGELVRIIKDHLYGVYDVAFSRNGSVFATCSADGTVLLYGIAV